MEDAVREKLEGSKELNVLIIGCYQVGKSTLINSLFHQKGQKYVRIAKEGAMDPCTKAVEPFTIEVKGISYNFYDSPGLQDGGINDIKYLRLIKEKCKVLHFIIYCTKMAEPVRPAEVVALKNLTVTYGEKFWENAVIALTFANDVQPVDPEEDAATFFKTKWGLKANQLNKVFADIISPKNKKIFEGLMKRTYPAGNARVLQLPGMGPDWRVDFWHGCLEACLPEGKGALLKLAWKNPHFVLKVAGATVGTTSAGASILAGSGCVGAGIALTATGILAPVGITLIVGGAVSTILGAGGTAGGATAIHSIKKEWKRLKKQLGRKDDDDDDNEPSTK